MSDPLNSSGELELRDYLSVLRRRKLIIVLTTIGVVLAALAYSLLQTPLFQASAEVLLDDQVSDQYINPERQTSAYDRQARVLTEIEVMRSRVVRDAVVDELGYAPAVSIEAKGETTVVRISAVGAEGQRAAREANAYATTFIEVRRNANIADLTQTADVLEAQIEEIDSQVSSREDAVAALQARADAASDPGRRAELEAQRNETQAALDTQRISLDTQRNEYSQQLGELRLAVNTTRVGGGQVVSQAETPVSPFSPNPRRNGIIALMLGLLLGTGLAFLREYLDDSVRTKDDLDAVTGGLDVLGLVPRVESWKDRARPELVSVTAPSSPAAEAYRGLRTSLQFIGIDRPLRLIQVTSSAAGEGKTTTLSNLGVALAGAGNRVILVDCDFRRPRLHQFFGLENRRGLTTAILGDHDAVGVMQSVPGIPRLSVLPSGPPPPNPSELLATKTAGSILALLAEHADYVLIDCPPLLPVADAIVVASHVDAVLLVTTVKTTTKRSLARSLELLRQVDAPLVGAVLNGLDAEAAYAYSYGEGSYAYAEAASQKRASGRGRRRREKETTPPSTAEGAAGAPMPEGERARNEDQRGATTR